MRNGGTKGEREREGGRDVNAIHVHGHAAVIEAWGAPCD